MVAQFNRDRSADRKQQRPTPPGQRGEHLLSNLANQPCHDVQLGACSGLAMPHAVEEQRVPHEIQIDAATEYAAPAYVSDEMSLDASTLNDRTLRASAEVQQNVPDVGVDLGLLQSRQQSRYEHAANDLRTYDPQQLQSIVCYGN